MRMMIAAVIGAAVVSVSAGCQTTGTPTAAPSTTASAKPSPSVTAQWSGTVYAFRAGADNHVEVYAVQGASRRLLATTPAGKDSCARNSVTVSPDGKMVAWVNSGLERLDGDLFVGTIGGAPAKKIAGHILCGGYASWWTADSRSLWVTQRTGDELVPGAIDATTGTFTAGTQPGRVTSPSGGYSVRTDAKKGSIAIVKADGSVVRTVDYQPEWAECEGWTAQALSEDGRYLAVGHLACDPSRMLSVQAVVDTTTGKEIKLPVAKFSRVYFRTDGTMIMVDGTDGYVVAEGKIVARQRLAVEGLSVLAYAV